MLELKVIYIGFYFPLGVCPVASMVLNINIVHGLVEKKGY